MARLFFFFFSRRRITAVRFALKRREEESTKTLEDKCLTLDEKLEKNDALKDKRPTLFK